jgi:hypothetical protein
MSFLAIALAAAASSPTLTPIDTAAAFRAAGFVRKAGQWRACDDPGTASYMAGSVETVGDLNGDGRPEAVIVEGSSFCYGDAGQGYVVVSKQTNGSWKKITGGSGMVTVLKTKGAANWPDLLIGGPGFCFPVERWNGKAYALHRFQYEGRPCKPRR